MGGFGVMKGKDIFDKWLRIVALIVAIVGLTLTIEGFLLDPAGQIHHSVLIYFGECLLFIGCVPIIEYLAQDKDKNKRK